MRQTPTSVAMKSHFGFDGWRMTSLIGACGIFLPDDVDPRVAAVARHDEVRVAVTRAPAREARPRDLRVVRVDRDAGDPAAREDRALELLPRHLGGRRHRVAADPHQAAVGAGVDEVRIGRRRAQRRDRAEARGARLGALGEVRADPQPHALAGQRARCPSGSTNSLAPNTKLRVGGELERSDPVLAGARDRHGEAVGWSAGLRSRGSRRSASSRRTCGRSSGRSGSSSRRRRRSRTSRR